MPANDDFTVIIMDPVVPCPSSGHMHDEVEVRYILDAGTTAALVTWTCEVTDIT